MDQESATERSETGDRPPEDVELVPRWLLLLTVGATTALLCVAGVGLLLGVVGHFNAIAALLLGGGLFAVFAIVIGRSLQAQPTWRPSPRSATWWAVAALLIAAFSAVTNAATDSQHVLHDRDPGSTSRPPDGWPSKERSSSPSQISSSTSRT